MTVSNLSTGMRPGVCLSTSRPTVPYEGQMIYETDTDLVYLWNGSAWVETVSALTKAPRGVMGYVSRTSGDIGSIAGGSQDLTGMSITFNAITGRLYKATWLVVANKAGVDRDGSGAQFCKSDNTVVAQVPLVTLSGNYDSNYSASAVFTQATGSATYKMRIYSFSGNMTVFSSATKPLVFIIEDIGAA